MLDGLRKAPRVPAETDEANDCIERRRRIRDHVLVAHDVDRQIRAHPACHVTAPGEQCLRKKSVNARGVCPISANLIFTVHYSHSKRLDSWDRRRRGGSANDWEISFHSRIIRANGMAGSMARVI